MHILLTLLRYRFIWLNLLLAVYLWVLQPPVFQRLSTAVERGRPDVFMGVVLLCIQVVELAGLLLKRPMSAYFARIYPDNDAAAARRENSKVFSIIFVPIFHLIGAVFLTIIALDVMCSGNGMGSGTASWLFVLIFFVVIIKEAFVVTMLIGVGTGASVEKGNGREPTDIFERLSQWLSAKRIDAIGFKDALKDLVGDLLLLVFSALAYTALWDVFSASSPLRHHGIERLWEYLGISIFFLAAYFTTRSVYLMEELSMQQSQKARIFSWISFLLVWLSSLWLIPGA